MRHERRNIYWLGVISFALGSQNVFDVEVSNKLDPRCAVYPSALPQTQKKRKREVSWKTELRIKLQFGNSLDAKSRNQTWP